MFKNPFARKAESREGEKWIPFLLKNGYTDASAESAAPKIEKMDARLREALLRWDTVGEYPDMEIEGFTVDGLVEYWGMHPIGAFLMMDWLLRDPEEAKYALAQPGTKLEVSQELIEQLAQSEENDRPEAE